MPTVAGVIAKTLREYDTEYFFLVTGGGGDQNLWIALRDEEIRMINCRHEQAAAYMADGYARISGKPGYVYGQFGPGVPNVLSGLPEPYWAMSPVVSLTSSVRTLTRHHLEYQELDQLPLHTALTKWNKELLRPEHVGKLLRDAIRFATSPPPGPVHLEIPNDLMGAEVRGVEVYCEEEFKRVPSLRAPPQGELIERALDALLMAEKPVIIAGYGVILSEAWRELVELAERLNIPVATSVSGKGSIPEDHELAIGVIGRYSRRSANLIVREADTVLVVGCRLGGLATDAFRVPRRGARIIQIDMDPTVLGTNYRNSLSILADAKLALRALVEEVERRGVKRERTMWEKHVAEQTREWQNDLARIVEENKKKGRPIHPATVMTALRDVLEPEDILVADTGYMAAWSGAIYAVKSTGRIYTRAAGSLGYALPAALGAALAAPEKKVACVIGDGGIGYHITELEAARRCGVPSIMILVLNNLSLAFEYHDQLYLYGRTVPEVYEFLDVRYDELAEKLGCKGYRVTDARELPSVLEEAYSARENTLIDIMIDREVSGPVTNYEEQVKRIL